MTGKTRGTGKTRTLPQKTTRGYKKRYPRTMWRPLILRAVDTNRPPLVVVPGRSFATRITPVTPITPITPITPVIPIIPASASSLAPYFCNFFAQTMGNSKKIQENFEKF